MKYYKYTFIILAILFLTCERDDICADGTPTTPRLLIEFFDVTDTDELKTVPRLTIYADNPNISIPDNEDASGAILVEPFETSRVFNVNASAAGLPLLVGEEGQPITLRYFIERDTNLRLNDDAATDSNVDVIEITYTPQFVYVSRACGFKSIFTELNIEIITDGDNWLRGTDFIDTTETRITVENEDSTHVQLFH